MGPFLILAGMLTADWLDLEQVSCCGIMSVAVLWCPGDTGKTDLPFDDCGVVPGWECEEGSYGDAKF